MTATRLYFLQDSKTGQSATRHKDNLYNRVTVCVYQSPAIKNGGFERHKTFLTNMFTWPVSAHKRIWTSDYEMRVSTQMNLD